MNMQKKLCPSCGSGKIEKEGEIYTCLSCKERCKEEDLLEYSVPNPSGLVINSTPSDTAQRIAEEMAKSYMESLYVHVSKPIGKCLVDCGFVGIHDAKNLARLIRSACLGAFKNTMDEVEKIAKKATGGVNE